MAKATMAETLPCAILHGVIVAHQVPLICSVNYLRRLVGLGA